MRRRPAPGEPSWRWRRLAIFPVIAFCCWQLHLLRDAPDTRVNDTMAFGYMVLIAVLILGYSGFATAQDVAAIWATRSGLPYAPTAYPPTAVGVPGMSPPQPARSDPTPPPGYAS